MNAKHKEAQKKIEALYQTAMDRRDATPSFKGDEVLEWIYSRQYRRAYRVTHDVAQFAWETRLYSGVLKARGPVDDLQSAN